MSLRVLAVASEIYPLIKTGGLADVAGALPLALLAEDVACTTLIPGYTAVLKALQGAETVHTEPNLFGGPVRLLRGQAAGLDLMVIDAPHLYDRPGGPYAEPDGADWPDNAFRFAGLARMAALICKGGLAGYQPDVLHAHDWQGGLAMAYLQFGAPRRVGTVMTIHNIAFQGVFPADMLGALGLPGEAYAIEGVEFYGMIGYLKAGLVYADRITTVSPSYAAEIQLPENGLGLDGLIRARADVLHGILNGIDDTVWDPATDKLIAAAFDSVSVAKRGANKQAVQARFGLAAAPEALVLGVISRLTWQKGLDLLLGSIDEMIGLGVQLAVLGAGEPGLEAAFRAAAARYPGRIGCVIGYDEALAHQMQAGIDALLVPSRFEPCGLTQLYALRYGAMPVVARVGGLADTVIDANEAALAAGVGTGVQFASGQFRPVLHRVNALWQQPATWRAIQKNAMQADVSWRRPAAQYAALYRGLLKP